MYPTPPTSQPSSPVSLPLNPQTPTGLLVESQPNPLPNPAQPNNTTTVYDLLKRMINLLGEEVVKQDPSLLQALKQKSEVLLTLDLNQTLSSQDQESYNLIVLLVDTQGKVSTFVKEKLEQILQVPQVTGASLTPSSPQPQPSHTYNQTSSSQISTSSPQIASIPKLITPPLLLSTAIGENNWEVLGDVGNIPPLPKDIHQILQSNSLLFPYKTVRDAHLLVLIPKTLNGNPLTVKNFEKLVENPRYPAHFPTKYLFPPDLEGYEDKPVAESYWILMTRHFIGGSFNKNYEEQKALVASCAKQTGLTYELPKLLEAVICILLHYVTTGERLYPDRPATITRCQERGFTVGGFGSKGLAIQRGDDYGSSHIVAGCRIKL